MKSNCLSRLTTLASYFWSGKQEFKISFHFTLKFMFSKKATKIAEIFTVDLTLCSKGLSVNEDYNYLWAVHSFDVETFENFKELSMIPEISRKLRPLW